jgi:hypothetical protein
MFDDSQVIRILTAIADGIPERKVILADRLFQNKAYNS